MATGDTRFAAGAWIIVMRARFPDYDRPDLVIRHDVTERLVVIDLREEGASNPHPKLVGRTGAAALEGSEQIVDPLRQAG